jgi:RNA polymerase sigma-70 factor (ECF subfamily)
MAEVSLETIGDMRAETPEPEPILRDRLQVAIEALPDGQRDVLTMFIEGYGHAEIAATLDIPVATSKTRLFHARATLRQALGAYAPEKDV